MHLLYSPTLPPRPIDMSKFAKIIVIKNCEKSQLTNVRLRIPTNSKKHFEAPRIENILSHETTACSIASQPSFLYQLFMSFCYGHGAVISPPTLTRFYYRRAYHVFNDFKFAILEIENQGLFFGCLICLFVCLFVFFFRRRKGHHLANISTQNLVSCSPC